RPRRLHVDQEQVVVAGQGVRHPLHKRAQPVAAGLVAGRDDFDQRDDAVVPGVVNDQGVFLQPVIHLLCWDLLRSRIVLRREYAVVQLILNRHDPGDVKSLEDTRTNAAPVVGGHGTSPHMTRSSAQQWRLPVSNSLYSASVGAWIVSGLKAVLIIRNRGI